jgi:hypothetical protein
LAPLRRTYHSLVKHRTASRDSILTALIERKE